MSASTSTQMTLTINGEPREVRSRSVRELLGELDYEGDFFAVALNHDILPRARWDDSVLSSGDAIEIVSPRQGG